MKFGDAVEALKAGEKLAREAWINSGGVFLYFVPDGQYPARTAIAKAEWGEEALVPYQAYVAMKTADGSVMPWTPSMAEMLADDWKVL